MMLLDQASGPKLTSFVEMYMNKEGWFAQERRCQSDMSNNGCENISIAMRLSDVMIV